MKEIVNLVGLGLLHGFGQLIFLDMVVSDEVDVLNLYLLTLVYGEIDLNGVFDYGVTLDFRADFALQETLFRKIPFDNV